MKRAVGQKPSKLLIVTAAEERCAACGSQLNIAHRRERWIERLDGYLHLVRRDKRCDAPGCPGPRRIFHAPEDLRLALPYHTFGLDVTIAIGERHLRGESLASIQRDLCARGIPIDDRHTGRVFRDFLALASVAAGDEISRREELRAQGGIVLMCDGVQFDDRAPVLYLAWDAVSGTPLFGERKAFRSEDDLRVLAERVKAMDVPVIAIVTDKEKGLYPALLAVFPDVPYQLCQTHFLKNCARVLEEDTSALGASVVRRASAVHGIAKLLHDAESPASKKIDEEKAVTPRSAQDKAKLSDVELAAEVCLLARQNARVSGKALLDPPELKRHERLEELRAVVLEAREKGLPARSEKGRGSSTTSRRHSRPAGTRRAPPGA